MAPSGLEVIGVMACIFLIIGAIVGTVVMIVSVCEAWGQIRSLRNDLDERASRISRLALDLSLGCDRLDAHNTFIVDIGKRLAALEAHAKRKGR